MFVARLAGAEVTGVADTCCGTNVNGDADNGAQVFDWMVEEGPT